MGEPRMAKSTQPTGWRQGEPTHFEGNVWLKDLSQPSEPGGVQVLAVQFAPNARTNWHSHPGGQVLHVLSGEGMVVNENGEESTLAPGDTYTAPANESHWHGSRNGAPMMHLSITSGGSASWGTPVSD